MTWLDELFDLKVPAKISAQVTPLPVTAGNMGYFAVDGAMSYGPAHPSVVVGNYLVFNPEHYGPDTELETGFYSTDPNQPGYPTDGSIITIYRPLVGDPYVIARIAKIHMSFTVYNPFQYGPASGTVAGDAANQWHFYLSLGPQS